ncbi:MAG: NADH-quinone oxidoreductase subunit NuoK [Candidatus Omnitrophica bacterium CG11_big_fil_rev_8_21_14_0_20_45_26]|uniref:NADH-quinone oxidoreductase subunit K n=1 Tax=Candidatus Abzuiibacterium crystallinum TaxID=1974748 RepID=A0A2H0LMC1_9BACT|nr:MAG: NADH-quinone oxidoreductase subunit NuoK [Candidatus Omnitrophica bacterium CG11_big_fil_rev_8_21_14_0_20_45_26]PIW63678.1 MAG: NADH-quinone oxidoreductase subunit NuoK [Candidatus Omnitrophica bacterium CG12_big_fil_rev_8_21_14_0_65_45_16]
MIPLHHILFFSSTLFCIGLFGALSRRHVVGILISVEIMLNAANVNLVAFSRWTGLIPVNAQVFAIFIITLAAAAAAVALAIVLTIYRNRKTIYTNEIDLLKW